MTLVARGLRGLELREHGAEIRDALSGRGDLIKLPVTESLADGTIADICLVAVHREQLEQTLPELAAATGVSRFIFMVNGANGSEALYTALSRPRVILSFSGRRGRDNRRHRSVPRNCRTID